MMSELIAVLECVNHMRDATKEEREAIDNYITHNSQSVLLVPLPSNPTNGDVLKILFPNIEWTGANGKDVDNYILNGDEPYSAKLSTFKSWWNAPFKKEVDYD